MINHVSDEVLVMKDGVAVESGAVREVFDHPQYPYTVALLEAIPHLESGRRIAFDFLKLAI